MGFNFGSKPKSLNFGIEGVTKENLEYFCKTMVIDELVQNELKIPYDKALGEDLDRQVRFYLVVRKDRSYDIISGEKFEKFLEDNFVHDYQTVLSDKAKACRNHFVKDLVNKHKKAADLLPKYTKDDLHRAKLN